MKSETDTPTFPSEEFDSLLFNSGDHDHAGFFQQKGALLLKKGDPSGLEFLDMALKLKPEDDALLMEQGHLLAGLGIKSQTLEHLKQAIGRFKQILRRHPDDLIAWQAIGYARYAIARTFNDFQYYLSSKAAYQRAMEQIASKQSESIGELYWDAASVNFEISKHSGEISDLNESIQLMTKAMNTHEALPSEFYEQFGTIYLTLGNRLGDVRFHLKAIGCHKQAISIAMQSHSSWLHLGLTLSQVYQLTHDEDYFQQANECLATSAKYATSAGHIYEAWAELLLHSGIQTKDAKRLHAATVKCQRALIYGQKSPKLYALWCESLALLGEFREDIAMLHSAREKAEELADLFGKCVESAYAKGIVHLSLGRFYKETDEYYKAIETFQLGLAINSATPKLWNVFAKAFHESFYLDGDEISLRNACRFHAKALQLSPESSYFFDLAHALFELAEHVQDIKPLQQSLSYFEQAFSRHPDANYLKPRWLYFYALAFDLLGDLAEEEHYYERSIELLNRVLVLDPDFENIHYRLGIVYTHLGELSLSRQAFEKAQYHFKLAHKRCSEDDRIYLEWGISLINMAENQIFDVVKEQIYKEAEFKLTQAAKLGNLQSYYHLGCLYALMEKPESSLYYLEKAMAHSALPPAEDMLEDAWLENVHEKEFFKAFMEKVDVRERITTDEY